MGRMKDFLQGRSIQRRLEEIRVLGLPYTYHQGNFLGNPKGRIGRHLKGKVIEMILNSREILLGGQEIIGTSGINECYALAFSKACGNKIDSKDFLFFDEGVISKGKNIIDPSKVCIHGFYDRKTDETHYFVMPKENLREN